ncbi:MAG TPA: hypothetical protein VK737_09340, partial [Opitutales bacterium]|nr:hypothetical protein [Opitutales bacterium]
FAVLVVFNFAANGKESHGSVTILRPLIFVKPRSWANRVTGAASNASHHQFLANYFFAQPRVAKRQKYPWAYGHFLPSAIGDSKAGCHKTELKK